MTDDLTGSRAWLQQQARARAVRTEPTEAPATSAPDNVQITLFARGTVEGDAQVASLAGAMRGIASYCDDTLTEEEFWEAMANTAIQRLRELVDHRYTPEF